MPDINDRLADAANELASIPMATRPFVPRPRRVGPALVVIATLAGAGGLTALVRFRNTPQHIQVANTPTTVDAVDATAAPAAPVVTLPASEATASTIGPSASGTGTTSTTLLPVTKPAPVISGTTDGKAWTLEVSTEANGVRCLQFTAEATPRTLCLTPRPDEWEGRSFVVKTATLMAAIGIAVPTELKGPQVASRATVTPMTGVASDGTMFLASVTPTSDPITQLPTGEECDYLGILDAIEADSVTPGYHPTHLLNVSIDHCRGDIAAGNSRAAEPVLAQTAFRIFRRIGQKWGTGPADHTNNCFDTESGTPDCVKLGYEKPVTPGTQDTVNLWDSLPNTGLSKRILPLVAAMGDEVLVVGGSTDWDHQSIGNLRDGRILNAAGSMWDTIPDAPTTLSSPARSAWTGTTLLVLAGTGDLLAFDPKAKTWANLGRLPGAARNNAATAWIGGEFYVYGRLITTDGQQTSRLKPLPKA